METNCTSTINLKRSLLLVSVFWNGRGGKPFEAFVDLVEGHIMQQTHMGYLLHEQITFLWIKHGEAEAVLSIALKMNLHNSLKRISSDQFLNDIMWFYGALKQLLKEEGGI